MYDVKKVPATPSWARKLLRFSQLKHLELPPELIDIANRDTIDREKHKLPSSQINALQFLVDHRHRAIMLDDGNYHSRNIILESLMYLNKSGPKIVLAHTNQHRVWANTINRFFPEEKIYIVGAHRNSSKLGNIPNTTVVTGSFEGNPDWIVSTYNQIFYDDILAKVRPVFLVCEELNAQSKPSQRFDDALAGLFSEIQSTIFIYNISQVNPYFNVDFATLIQNRFAGYSQHMLLRLVGYLWTTDNASRIFDMERNGSISTYLTDHGYKNIDMLKLLPLFGVSVDLLQTNTDKNLLYMTNNKLVQLRATHLRDQEKGIASYIALEKRLAKSFGTTPEIFYEKNINQNKDSNNILFESFKNNSWCNFKAEFIMQLVDQMALGQHKILFLAETEGMIRSIRLVSGCEELATSRNYENCIARYIYPSIEWKKYCSETVSPQHNSMCVSVHDLANTDILNGTQIIILADIPYQTDIYREIVRICREYDIKLIHPIITSSFEDYLLKKHKQQLENV
jgi:hypothetical protein